MHLNIHSFVQYANDFNGVTIKIGVAEENEMTALRKFSIPLPDLIYVRCNLRCVGQVVKGIEQLMDTERVVIRFAQLC